MTIECAICKNPIVQAQQQEVPPVAHVECGLYTHTDLVLAEDIGREKGRREEREAIEPLLRAADHCCSVLGLEDSCPQLEAAIEAYRARGEGEG